MVLSCHPCVRRLGPENLWKVVTEGRGEAVPRVEVRGPVLGVQVVGVLRQGHRREIEVDAVGGIVERLGPGVAGESRKTVPVAGAQGGLQCVVGGRAGGGELVHEAVLRKCQPVAKHVGLIGVAQAHQLGSFAADIPQLQGHALAEFLLEVQVPVLHVRSRQVSRGHEQIRAWRWERRRRRGQDRVPRLYPRSRRS